MKENRSRRLINVQGFVRQGDVLTHFSGILSVTRPSSDSFGEWSLEGSTAVKIRVSAEIFRVHVGSLETGKDYIGDAIPVEIGPDRRVRLSGTGSLTESPGTLDTP